LWEIRFHTLAIMPTTTIVVNFANETPCRVEQRNRTPTPS
jgi:hypothetical protein